MIAALAAVALSLLAQVEPVPGADRYEWCIAAPPEIPVCFTTTAPETPIAFPPGRAAHVEASAWIGSLEIDLGVSRPVVESPCPGDLDWDGTVGGSDYLLLASHFGRSCP